MKFLKNIKKIRKNKNKKQIKEAKTIMRKEHDILGEVELLDNFYGGVHTKRATENFPFLGYKIDRDFIRAFAYVKLACAKAIKDVDDVFPKKSDAIIQACEELAEGKLDDAIVVDAIQGGAGTSLNMNVNEVIANRALELLGKQKGQYDIVSPINDINKYQSTNDTFPTALKIAAIFKLRSLEKAVLELQEACQRKEEEFSDVVKIGRTQLMEAVLTTLGKEFSSFAEAFSRDRWRIYKCEERLRVVNLGGTAIGTSVGAKKMYIFGVIDHLRDLTGIGLARAENLVENTQNADVFSEVSGILKAHATNLIKCSNDLRTMASLEEINLPKVQAGSSIMPGKVNPVIPEVVSQIGLKILGNDSIISHASAMGQLELNHNMPLIAFCFLESLELLIRANYIFAEKCIIGPNDGITPNKEHLKEKLNSSTATITALLPKFGYEKLSEISQEIKSQGIGIKEYFTQNKLLSDEEFENFISAEHVLSIQE